MLQKIDSSKTTHSIYESIDDDFYLVIGSKYILDTYDKSMNGVFESEAEYLTFLKNLDRLGVDYLMDYIDLDEMKKAKYCVRIGVDAYVVVDYEDVEITIEYDYFWLKKDKNKYPYGVEIIADLKIKL